MDVLGFDFSNPGWAETGLLFVIVGFYMIATVLESRQRRRCILSGSLKENSDWTDPFVVGVKLGATLLLVIVLVLVVRLELPIIWFLAVGFALVGTLEKCMLVAVWRYRMNSKRLPVPQGER